MLRIKRAFLLLLVFISCKPAKDYKKAEDAQEAAREFIQATLEGNEQKAQFYLYKDSSDNNLMLLREWKKNYNRFTAEEKVGYKEASIIVLESNAINDSAINFTYSNSYKNKTTTLRIIRHKGEWLVDFKDLLNHND